MTEPIHITEADMNASENKNTGLVKTVTIKIGEEDLNVDVQPDAVVGWKDIIQADHDSMVDIKEPVSAGDPTEFHFSVLSNLRDDMKNERTAGKSDRDVFISLATRYHPDLYQDASPEVKDLAVEYTQALNALKTAGELKL